MKSFKSLVLAKGGRKSNSGILRHKAPFNASFKVQKQ